MEAQKLKKKKNSISKTKIKKTIKNVLCRPDPIFWPIVTEAERSLLQTALERHRVPIPVFKKPHWNDIKLLPKNKRPQPPNILKVDGLLFGISSCCDAVKKQQCAAVLIDSNVNPQAIVQPIIEACTSSNTSVLCFKDLRNLSQTYFGIKTSCLGVKKECFHDLHSVVNGIFKNYKLDIQPSPILSLTVDHSKIFNVKKEDLQMDLDAPCPYLFRTNRKCRVFVPDTEHLKDSHNFQGQHFIKLPQENKPKGDSKTYMKMILKKITNNSNRANQKL